MLYNLLSSKTGLVVSIGALVTFALTFILTKALMHKLPTDIGRAFAVNAEKAKGKPRGAGIIFVLVFCCSALLFAPLSIESAIYIVLMAAAMITGFLDDASRNPWSDYKKGALDLVISIGIAVDFVLNNSTVIRIHLIEAITGSSCTIELPKVLYAILATILVWMAINVVNCTDGVDGLCTSITLISLGTFFYLMRGSEFAPFIVIMMSALMAYLWFNASPSILLMGDAGSRTIGVFFALAAMKSGAPLLFLPLCAMFIIDGGLGLLKIFLLRFLKIKIFANTRMPLHDHFRKEKGWSDTHTVIRFCIIQFAICGFVIIFHL